jgi:type IX secretion system PorP/SprF family membrane protein
MKKRSVHIILLTFVLVMISIHAKSQQMPIYSQYMFNNFLINPACAGAEGYTAVNLTARDQWIGLPNSPKTYALSGNMRIMKKGFVPTGASKRSKYRRSPSGRVGIGGYMYSDKVGLINRTGMQFSYGYHIFLKKSQLSFGLGVSAYQYKINRSEIVLSDQPSDNLIDNSDLNMFIPDAQVGVAYMYQGLYVGLSVTDLFESTLRFSKSSLMNIGSSYSPSADLKTYRNYNLLGYYFIEINKVYAIEPALWLKISEMGAKQIDISTRLYYQEDYWGGLSYRTGAYGGMIIIMGGVRYQRYYFGYAFDYTLSNIMKSTYGSHEIMLAAKFGDNARRYRWVSRY